MDIMKNGFVNKLACDCEDGRNEFIYDGLTLVSVPSPDGISHGLPKLVETRNVYVDASGLKYIHDAIRDILNVLQDVTTLPHIFRGLPLGDILKIEDIGGNMASLVLQYDVTNGTIRSKMTDIIYTFVEGNFGISLYDKNDLFANEKELSGPNTLQSFVETFINDLIKKFEYNFIFRKSLDNKELIPTEYYHFKGNKYLLHDIVEYDGELYCVYEALSTSTPNYWIRHAASFFGARKSHQATRVLNGDTEKTMLRLTPADRVGNFNPINVRMKMIFAGVHAPFYGGDEYILGKDNALVIKSKEDMQFFKNTTKDTTVKNLLIMGRKTFDSLGCKPLPFRKSIVISRNPKALYDKHGDMDDVFFVSSFAEVFSLIVKENMIAAVDTFVVGGGQLYKEILRNWDTLIDKIYISHFVDDSVVRSYIKQPSKFVTIECDLLEKVEHKIEYKIFDETVKDIDYNALRQYYSRTQLVLGGVK